MFFRFRFRGLDYDTGQTPRKNHQVDHSNGSRSLPQGLLLVKAALIAIDAYDDVCKALLGHRVSDFQQNISVVTVSSERCVWSSLRNGNRHPLTNRQFFFFKEIVPGKLKPFIVMIIETHKFLVTVTVSTQCFYCCGRYATLLSPWPLPENCPPKKMYCSCLRTNRFIPKVDKTIQRCSLEYKYKSPGLQLPPLKQRNSIKPSCGQNKLMPKENPR